VSSRERGQDPGSHVCLTIEETNMTALRTWIPALAITAGLACPACAATIGAQPYGNAWGHGQRRADDLREAWQHGYHEGFDRGRDDARRRRYDYRGDGVYREGTRGWDRRGNRDDYRRAFQEGFAAGYDDGYYGRGERGDRYGRGEPGYGRYPAYPSAPGYPPSAYPGAYPGGYSRYGMSEAYDRGYREGLDKGRDDGQDRDRYDPRRQKWYREGDRGYKKEYGPREEYKTAYREGFLRGYDEGYRRY